MFLKGKNPRDLHGKCNRNWACCSIRVTSTCNMKERTRGKWGWSCSQCSEPISQLVATERGRSQPTTGCSLSLLGQMLPLPLPCWLSTHYCKFNRKTILEGKKKSELKASEGHFLKSWWIELAQRNIQWAGIPGDQWGNGRSWKRGGNTTVPSHNPERWCWLHFPV